MPIMWDAANQIDHNDHDMIERLRRQERREHVRENMCRAFWCFLSAFFCVVAIYGLVVSIARLLK